ncbi:MAG: BACON domain-containing protein [Desulfobacterales bacterium]|nr:BACON domain-containing protein [Desulfobacterales bacterium]
METGSYNISGNIWGSSSNNVFVMGAGIFHYNGSSWTQMEKGPIDTVISGVWGTSASDIYVLGLTGKLFQYNGKNWIKIADTGHYYHLHDVWGSSENDVFAVGYLFDYVNGEILGKIIHYDGSSWTEMETGYKGEFTGIWGSSANDVFATGVSSIYHYDGNRWTEMEVDILDNDGILYGIWGNSDTDVFAFGLFGTIIHYNGSNWIKMDVPVSVKDAISITGMWGSSANDVFAVGYVNSEFPGIILHYNGNIWTEMESGYNDHFYKVWGISEKDVFVIGNYSMYHYDGNSWTKVDVNNDWILLDIWGASESNIFTVSAGSIYHYDGSNWSTMGSFNAHEGGIWGSSGNNVFAVGRDGTILHYAPSSNSPTLLTVPDFQTIPATSSTTIIHISNSGTDSLTWTATETTPWFSIIPKSGTNTGTITVNYESNPGDTRTGTITITAPNAANSPKTVKITQASKQTHFTPAWIESSDNAMSLWITKGSIDSVPLSVGDEVAVFDGNKCVGSRIVDKEISEQNPLIITVSDFSEGNEISFRLWDASEEKELAGIAADFEDMTYYGKPIATPGFEGNDDYRVKLNYSSTYWTKIDGSVLYDGIPLCAMVLANGQYKFSCDTEGAYELKVPTDENGKITLFAFADGFAPFRQILTPDEAANFTINMQLASQDSPHMALTTYFDTAIRPGWIKIRGEVFNESGTSLCAMVLANGQHMFTCGENPGEYEMEVPFNENGEITLFGFCDGFQPYKRVFKSEDRHNSIAAGTISTLQEGF